ncbi:hypothetical protein BFW01_g12615 [Lasiodiplodia theobromae]|nr:hypothetical protein BFW01_g12615 [Lasiodiplodia theobromae]
MIESLKECLNENGDKPFSLWKLSSKINEKQYRRQNPCFPHDRLKKHDRQIELAPLKEKRSKKDDNKMVLTQRASGADLTLCFALGFNPVTQDHIEKLARGLPQAFETAGLMLQRIDWVNLEQRPPVDFKSTVSALNVAHRWLQKAFPDRKRSAKLQEAPLEAPLGGPLGAPLKVGTDDSSTRRKLPQSDGVPTNAETAEIDSTELDNTPAEATPSSVEEPLLQHDPDNSASDATRAPLMEQTLFQGRKHCSTYGGGDRYGPLVLCDDRSLHTSGSQGFRLRCFVGPLRPFLLIFCFKMLLVSRFPGVGCGAFDALIA